MDHTSIITQVSNPKEEEIISLNQEKGKESQPTAVKFSPLTTFYLTLA